MSSYSSCSPEKKLPGTTQEFDCAIGDDIVKVRYGIENGKVQGAVLASRLLWALGFGADGRYGGLWWIGGSCGVEEAQEQSE